MMVSVIAGCAQQDSKTVRKHPGDEPRFYSADSGSGHLVGYDQHGDPVYGSGKPWKKGDKPMRR